MLKKVLLVFGTRPEAIKMAPLVKELEREKDRFITKVCITSQHREMLDQVLSFFDITADYDLNLMRPNQTLHQLTADVITEVKRILDDYKPDYIFVHGDTTTSMAASLAAFYSGIKICHIEAGLRTYNKLAPFPEEINRQITGRLANLHFAPTAIASENLLKERVKKGDIFVTGNTVIDALLMAKQKIETYNDPEIEYLKTIVDPNKKIILVTGHRRENFGGGFVSICGALNELSKRDDIQIIYPVHLNPNVQKTVYSILGNSKSIHLIPPLAYPAFVWLMIRCHFILTDSGGIQEEAPSLGKPVLVMRDTTERPEAVTSGTVILVGTDKEKIIKYAEMLLNDAEQYKRMSAAHNPYGSGDACKNIVKKI